MYKNVLLIDSTVKNYEEFLSSCNSFTLPIIYTTSDMVLNILKSNFTSIERVGICFASRPRQVNIFLDNQPFFEDNLDSDNVKFIISIINKFSIKNIDYLACNTLNYSNWVNYYNVIKETGVVVGASSDQTGNIKYGGDWVMESTQEDIELIYFTKSIELYSYLLDVGGYTTSIIANNKIYSTGKNYDGQFGIGITTYTLI
jgi:hypothetical protein